MLDTFENILWDFDGVIMDSMPIRNNGFRLVLKSFPAEQVEELMAYHLANGGLSRYHKFRYFFETIRKEQITNDIINQYAHSFSEIMMKNLIDENLLIEDSMNFIRKQHMNFEMHIVSGSDGRELNKICERLKIDRYFNSINGSPTPKKKLVKDILEKHCYDVKKTVLIGDSINDWEAAIENQIYFIGNNNEKLIKLGRYIESFK